MQLRHVAILLFDDIEVLDFAGPFEVFNVTGELNTPSPFNVFTVAESEQPIKARGGLTITSGYSIASMPKADILVIPGGYGTRALLENTLIIEWLKTQMSQVEFLCSVCTGSMALAKANLLTNCHVTTHHDNLDDLRKLVSPDTTVIADKRYLDNGKILTAGGISAGIDMSLYLVNKLYGAEILKKTLAEMEYHWTPEVDLRWQDTC